MACAACICVDGTVTIDEGELLRAVSDCLGCPMPPLIASGFIAPDDAHSVASAVTSCALTRLLHARMMPAHRNI